MIPPRPERLAASTDGLLQRTHVAPEANAHPHTATMHGVPIADWFAADSASSALPIRAIAGEGRTVEDMAGAILRHLLQPSVSHGRCTG